MSPDPDPLQKYFCFSELFTCRRPKSLPYFRNPVPLRGAFAIATNVGRDAVAVEGACDSAGSGRRKRVVLMPQGWRQVGGQDTADDGDNPRSDRRGERV